MEPKPTTKGKMLSALASIYDTLGLISPTTLKAKLVLAKTWTRELTWDEPIPEDIRQEWTMVMEEWAESKFSAPRFSGYSNQTSEFHVFADASSKAIGIAAYLVINERSNLILAKSRIKPKAIPDNKENTIPRLELKAIADAVKIADYLCNELRLNKDEVYVWSDSSCSIDRIRSGKKFERVLQNQLLKIRGRYPIWHVRSEDNPADIATRGSTPLELQHNDLWLKGTTWLPALTGPILLWCIRQKTMKS